MIKLQVASRVGAAQIPNEGCFGEADDGGAIFRIQDRFTFYFAWNIMSLFVLFEFNQINTIGNLHTVSSFCEACSGGIIGCVELHNQFTVAQCGVAIEAFILQGCCWNGAGGLQTCSTVENSTVVICPFAGRDVVINSSKEILYGCGSRVKVSAYRSNFSANGVVIFLFGIQIGAWRCVVAIYVF